MVSPSRQSGNSSLFRPGKGEKAKKQGKTGLNAAQEEAVRYGEGALLIAAGAGSGKTKTITSRLLSLLERGVPGREIVAITFTNKAAREMEERVSACLPAGREQRPFIGTFHSFGARILRSHAAAFGRTAGYSIYDADDALKIAKQLVKDHPAPLAKELGPAPLSREFSAIKNGCLVPELPANFHREAKPTEPDAELLTLFLAYEERLRAQNAFDFDDLIQKPVRLFLEHPDVRARYDERFRHVLVDEYQDINAAQYALVRLLSERHGNLCVVGDDNQAIYSFRGADFQNFLNFERDFPNARVVLLEENYRSTANIIRAASSMVSNNILQKPKRLWTKNPEGALVRVVETSGPEEEAEKIAEFAVKNPGTTAILYRTNAQSRAIEQTLLAEGVPYVIFGGLRFYDRKEVKDLVAALRYARNPRDGVALERLDKAFLKSDFRRLRDELPALLGRAGAGTFAPAELLGFVLKETGYLASLRKHFRNAEERTENVRELLASAAGYDSLDDFLERISLLEGVSDSHHPWRGPAESGDVHAPGPAQDRRGAVRIMTIHLSKGLEFDRVIVAGVTEGLLPHQMSLGTPFTGGSVSAVEEERRLMYVAMTRAKQELVLMFHGVGSRFLYEIPQELVEFESTVAANRELDDSEERYITND